MFVVDAGQPRYLTAANTFRLQGAQMGQRRLCVNETVRGEAPLALVLRVRALARQTPTPAPIAAHRPVGNLGQHCVEYRDVRLGTHLTLVQFRQSSIARV